MNMGSVEPLGALTSTGLAMPSTGGGSKSRTPSAPTQISARGKNCTCAWARCGDGGGFRARKVTREGEGDACMQLTVGPRSRQDGYTR
jgi:hypothetical protein